MYYPLMLDLTNKNVCIIGGGKVAFSKFKMMLDFNIFPTIVSPSLIPEFQKYSSKFKFIKDYYNDKYIENMDIVIAATNINSVNQQVLNFCRLNNILINVVDKPDMCDFIVPAYIKRGSLIISISTEGKSPALAKKIKNDIANLYPPQYEQYLDILGDLRQKILNSNIPKQQQKNLIIGLIYKSLEQLKNFDI